MDIHKKIEEIRQKPDHVRMNYVILCVGVSMFFLVVFWGFAIKFSLTSNSNNTSNTETCANNSQTCKTPEDSQNIKNSFESMDKLDNFDDSNTESITDLMGSEQ